MLEYTLYTKINLPEYGFVLPGNIYFVACLEYSDVLSRGQ